MTFPSLTNTGVLLILGALCCTIGAASGYKVRGWEDGAGQTKEANARADALTKDTADLIASNKSAVAEFNKKTDANANDIGVLTTKLEGQTHAFHQFEINLRNTPVGDCHFNPDADRLLQQAYDSAFGNQASPDPAKN